MEKEEEKKEVVLEKVPEKKVRKHYLIKSHKSHKWLIAVTILVMFIMGYGLYSKVMELDTISEDNFRILTVGLLFSLDIIIMILIVLIAVFYIEIKDKYLVE